MGLESTVPMHPQLRLFTPQLFLDFCAILFPEWPLIFLVITIHQVIWPSPGTLGAKTPVNCRAKWFCCCTSDCEYFFDLTGTEGKDRSKTSIYHKFGCHLYLLQHDSTLKKKFHSNVFFEKWNDTEKTKKNLRQESWKRTSDTTKWDKLGQVGVVGQVGQGAGILVGQVEQGEVGLQIFVGQVEQGQRVCPL